MGLACSEEAPLEKNALFYGFSGMTGCSPDPPSPAPAAPSAHGSGMFNGSVAEQDPVIIDKIQHLASFLLIRGTCTIALASLRTPLFQYLARQCNRRSSPPPVHLSPFSPPLLPRVCAMVLSTLCTLCTGCRRAVRMAGVGLARLRQLPLPAEGAGCRLRHPAGHVPRRPRRGRRLLPGVHQGLRPR